MSTRLEISRRQRRPGEPAVGLQQPVEDDREPVQDDLRERTPRASRLVVLTISARTQCALALAGLSSRRDRPGGDHDDQGKRHQDDDRPGQQRRGDLADARLFGRIGCGSFGRAGQHRDHGAGQRAAQDQLVDEVGHLVRGDIGRAQAARADGLREHQRADEPEHPGQHGEAGDERGATGNTRGELAAPDPRTRDRSGPHPRWSAHPAPDSPAGSTATAVTDRRNCDK